MLLGNLVYFFALMPHLPLLGQHRPNRIDFGLLVDFWVCVVFYGIVEMLDHGLRRDKPPAEGRKI